MNTNLITLKKEDLPKALEAYQEKASDHVFADPISQGEIIHQIFKPLLDKYKDDFLQAYLCGKWYRGSGADGMNYRTRYLKYTLELDEKRDPVTRVETVECQSFTGEDEQKVYRTTDLRNIWDESKSRWNAQWYDCKLEDRILPWQDFFLDYILVRNTNKDEWAVASRTENVRTWAADRMNRLFTKEA